VLSLQKSLMATKLGGLEQNWGRGLKTTTAVGPSVSLFVTALSLSKRCKLRSQNFSLWAAPKNSFLMKFGAAGWKGFHQTRTTPPKKTFFAAIGSSSKKRWKIGTDMLFINIITSNGHELFSFFQHGWPSSMTLNSKKVFWQIFRKFWLHRIFQKWIATK